MYSLIVGVFFQDKIFASTARLDVDGIQVAVLSDLYRFMFYGFIGPLVEGSKVSQGYISDVFGESEIGGVVITENEFSFNKLYLGRQRPILYEYTKRKGSIWYGEYTGETTGRGVSQCILTPVGSEFFAPEQAMALLGRNEAFTWPKPWPKCS